MNEFAPSMPTIKATGDFLNHVFAGRGNIRQCFLLEWAAYSISVAQQTDPKAPELLEERLREARASINQVAQDMSAELGIGLSKTLKDLTSGEGFRTRQEVYPDVASYIEEALPMEVATFRGTAKRGVAFSSVCRAIVELDKSAPDLEKVERYLTSAHFALRPDPKRDFDHDRVLASMVNEARGLRSQRVTSQLRREEEELLCPER